MISIYSRQFWHILAICGSAVIGSLPVIDYFFAIDWPAGIQKLEDEYGEIEIVTLSSGFYTYSENVNIKFWRAEYYLPQERTVVAIEQVVGNEIELFIHENGLRNLIFKIIGGYTVLFLLTYLYCHSNNRIGKSKSANQALQTTSASARRLS